MFDVHHRHFFQQIVDEGYLCPVPHRGVYDAFRQISRLVFIAPVQAEQLLALPAPATSLAVAETWKTVDLKDLDGFNPLHWSNALALLIRGKILEQPLIKSSTPRRVRPGDSPPH